VRKSGKSTARPQGRRRPAGWRCPAAALAALLTACSAITPAPRYTHSPTSQVLEELARRQHAGRRRLLQVVDQYLGVPYKWGGTTRQGMDCSGFARAVFRETYGVELPRTAEQMYALGQPLDDRAELQPGDLVFFRNTDEGPGVSHVGVYLDDGRFAHTSRTSGSAIASLETPYFRQRYAGARRISR
jgi:cell wall-associated NlpC family hydrolase